MFLADFKCSQATWQTVPNSRTGSTKASVSEAVVHMWHRTHVIRGRPKGSSVAFGDEMPLQPHTGSIGLHGVFITITTRGLISISCLSKGIFL